MPEKCDAPLSRLQIARRSGSLSAFGYVRLIEMLDGQQRGVRLLEFRNASGLRFTVNLDRAFDIAEIEWKGTSLGWHGPSGLTNPSLQDYEGENGFSWLRNATGFLVTCGMDHTLVPQEVPAEHYGYPGLKSVQHSLHGRVSTLPARLIGYGERWEGDRCILWAEGEVRQSSTFAENLVLHRRIEVDLFGHEIRMEDEVKNAGFNLTPHMYFYHVNLGHPLLDEGARYLAPISDVVWAAHDGARYHQQGAGYQKIPAPADRFVEQVWQHEAQANDENEVPVALVNDALELGLEVVTRKDQLPCLFEWQHFQSGGYALGIEPSTHHVLGNLAARERGEMIWLAAQESRHYSTRFNVLASAEAIATAEANIRTIYPQPKEDFPVPSGNFVPLTGRRQPA